MPRIVRGSASVAGQLFVGVFMFVWVGGWSAGTLLFDGILLGDAYKQWVSQSFTAVDGIVLHSEVVASTDSEGDTKRRYAMVIEFVDDDHQRRSETVADWSERAEALEAVNWLRKRVGLTTVD